MFCLFVFFFWNEFSYKNTNQVYARCLLMESILYPSPPKSIIRSHVVNVEEGMEMTKQTKTKIGVGSILKAKVGEMENITREGRSKRMGKEVVGCVQSLVGKKKFPVLFEYGQKKEMGSSSIFYLSEKEEVKTEEPISHLP